MKVECRQQTGKLVLGITTVSTALLSGKREIPTFRNQRRLIKRNEFELSENGTPNCVPKSITGSGPA